MIDGVAGCAKTFGVPIDILSLNETVDLADKSMSAALPTHVMLVMN